MHGATFIKELRKGWWSGAFCGEWEGVFDEVHMTGAVHSVGSEIKAVVSALSGGVPNEDARGRFVMKFVRRVGAEPGIAQAPKTT